MPKPIVTVAQVRQCDVPAARAFCEAVQRCFHGNPPPFQVIAQQITQSPMATPEQIAERISPTLSYRAPKPAKYQRRVQSRGGFGDYFDSAGHDTPALGRSTAQKNPLRSRNRLEPGKAATCPHGIPFYRKCGICDKEKFQELTGFDR
jgi:hypothetical protein